MLTRTTDHDFYEVWNEWIADSVFVDHRPTKAELNEIHKTEKWSSASFGKLQVFKVKRVYTNRIYTKPASKPTPKLCSYCDGKGSTNKCSYCHGSGVKSDNYTTFDCPWCDKGRIKESHKCPMCGQKEKS